MAVEGRPELVGKRFLCVSGEEPLGRGEIARCGWRAGVIRAVTSRDIDTPDFSVCVEFDHEEWEKRQWIRVFEDFQIFLLEQGLVWASRTVGGLPCHGPNGTNGKPVLWPALSFRTLVGQASVGPVSVVEFFSDRQLEFHPRDVIHQPYQDEADILSPLLRDNPSLQEEVKAWLKQQKVQEIFMQGKYSLNGLRVKVYRQDSATQWFTGIITQHDQHSSTMIVMNDQVLEPQNVDPSLVQVMFIDDVVHSLLAGENVTARRRSRSNKTNPPTHGHLRGQSGSPGPMVSRPSLSSCPPVRLTSERSAPLEEYGGEEEEDERMKDGRRGSPDIGRHEPSKSKCKPGVSKRRKGVKEEEEEDGERKEGTKRHRGLSGSDPYESNNTGVCPRLPDSSPPFDKTHKSHYASKPPAKREKSQSPVGPEGWTQKKHPAPWAADEEAASQSANGKRQETEKPRPLLSQPANPSARCNGVVMETGAALEERRREGVEGGAEEAETRHDGVSHSEDSEAVSALLAYQESERMVSMETSACVVFNALPGECELPDSELPSDPEVKSSDYGTAEAPAPGSESEAGTGHQDELATRHPSPPGQGVAPDNAGGSDKPRSPSDSRATIKGEQGPDATPRPKSSPRPSSPPEDLRPRQHAATDKSRPKPSTSPESGRHRNKRPGSSPNGAEHGLPHSGFKPQCGPGNPTPVPNQTPTTFSNKSPMASATLTKTHMPVPIHTTAASTKLHAHTHTHTHTAVTPTKAPAAASSTKNSTHAANRSTVSSTPVKPHVSPITPTKTHSNQSRTSVLNPSPHKSLAKASNHTTNNTTPTKSPLIVDRNEPFTVYRDPALVGEDPDARSPRGTTPSPSPQPPGSASLAGHGPPSPRAPEPHHLLPSLLPALSPSAALLAGHGPLGALGLGPHPLALPPSAALLGQTPLGLYPLLWPPYPNGTHPYTALGLSAGMTEGSLKRNTPSPWLPQASLVESQGLRTPVPVRPASADPHHSVKNHNPHASPSVSKTTEEERKTLTADALRGGVNAQIKADPDRGRNMVAKNGQMHAVSHAHTHRPFLSDSLPCRPKPSRAAAFEPAAERCTSRYQEESRRILQESIEVAPFTAKLQPPPGQEREPFPSASQGAQPPAPSNYYSSLCSSVANEPPRRPAHAAELSALYERPGSSRSVSLSISGSTFSISSHHSPLKAPHSKPPPLVKRHPEKEEGLLGKMSERLVHQASSLEQHSQRLAERGGALPAGVSISSSSASFSASSSLRSMPSLHRAPIFHPPAPPMPARKEAGQGRLTPPTLTPVQPVCLLPEQQRPPTLQPELKRQASAAAGKRASDMAAKTAHQTYHQHQHHQHQHHQHQHQHHQHHQHQHHHHVPEVWRGPQHLDKPANGHGAAKQPSATASVIVRPSSAKDSRTNDRLISALKQPERTRASGEHKEVGRVGQTNAPSKEGCAQYKRGILWTPLDSVHCPHTTPAKTDHTMSAVAIETGSKSYVVSTAVSMATGQPPRDRTPVPWRPGLAAEEDSRGTCRAHADITSSSPISTSCAATPCRSSGDFMHLKKQRAALAAAQSRNSAHVAAHASHSHAASQATSTGPHNASSTHPPEKDPALGASPPKRPRPAGTMPEGASQNSSSSPSNLSNGQPPPQATSSQAGNPVQNNYHKLKKAWLTRHSEEDSKGTGAPDAAGGTDGDTASPASNSTQPIRGQDDRKSSSEDRKPGPDERKSMPEERKATQEDRKPPQEDRKSSMDEPKAGAEELQERWW
ncbi:hypothetical protein AALO_G00232320 [Alosa alosa]|uniref:JmjC domain-containing histone demethylation protein 2C n=1 Tax=Alosa alosa TaxID=278164 RepID=A0AAV6FUE3_9TELE|nr:hypothetical protein AALO_G00232320 [Alosa alosa]